MLWSRNDSVSSLKHFRNNKNTQGILFVKGRLILIHFASQLQINIISNYNIQYSKGELEITNDKLKKKKMS